MGDGEERRSSYGRMCNPLGRELTRKLICGLQTIAHSNKTQEKRTSNREYVQEHINTQTSLCPEIKYEYQTPLQSNLS